MSAKQALEKLGKWRSVFAGWQLGTRLATDPECNAVKDHREVTMLLRVELTALAGLLIEKGIFTQAEFGDRVGFEAYVLDMAYEQRFPGIRTDLDGVHYHLPEAAETMKGWPA